MLPGDDFHRPRFLLSKKPHKLVSCATLAQG
jgi:hypothetical protein